ncbi:MAG: 3-hydroxybutyryl-CoA dehydrogenase [Deltaproteobacteria bacterium HGW-Deltaproteobacteria-6]|nr:MAG: 3-hydroxybutyryl-CoA dehydrogenase [Deltaproteobacteria bacterium HGW-Deltaproteobacteria-6]
MELKDIKKVLILGAGTMGQQIGFVCAMHGYNVTLYDISDDVLKTSLKRMEKLGASFFVPTGRMKAEQLQEVMGRITTTSDPQAAAKDADIISESVPENPKIKAKVFAEFDKLCPERTIFTTNTSLLMPSTFAGATGRPEKLVALHFHDARMTNVVDVMPHPGTNPAVTQLVHDFAVSIGQIAIMLHRESNGYVYNAMIANLLTTAMTLATTDVAGIEDIDRAWMGVTRMPIGPFGIMDQMGLQTVWTVTDYLAHQAQGIQADQIRANADFVKQYVDRGELGAKTKKGFYSYPMPAYTQPGFLAGKTKK